MNRQMEERCRAKYVGRGLELPALSGCVTLPKSPYVQQPRSSLNPEPCFFMEASLPRNDGLNE